MKNMTIILTCLLLSVACKKEEPPQSSTGSPKTMTVAEQAISGDWILKRTDYCNMQDSVISTTNHSNPSQCHLDLKEDLVTSGTPCWYDGIMGLTCNPSTSPWQLSVSGTSLTLGSMVCTITYQTADSLIMEYGAPKSIFYLKK